MNPWHPNAFVESIFVNRVLFDGLTRPGQGPQPGAGPGRQLESRRRRLELDLQAARRRRSGATASRSPPTTSTTRSTRSCSRRSSAPTGAATSPPSRTSKAVDPTTVKFNLDAPVQRAAVVPGLQRGHPAQARFEGQADPWALNAFNKGTPVSQRTLQGRELTRPARASSWPATTPTSVASRYLDKLVFKVVADANTQIAQALSGELQHHDHGQQGRRRSGQERRAGLASSRASWSSTTGWRSIRPIRASRTSACARRSTTRSTARRSSRRSRRATAASPTRPSCRRFKAYYDPSHESAIPVQIPTRPGAAVRRRLDAFGPDGVLQKDGQPFPVHHGRRPARRPAADQRADPAEPEGGRHPGGAELRWSGTPTSRRWWSIATTPPPSTGGCIRTIRTCLPYYHSSAAGKGFNIPGYKDPKLDDLLTQGPDGDATSPSASKPSNELQTYMADNLPYIFLWYPQEIDVDQRESCRACPTSTCATTCTTCRSGGSRSSRVATSERTRWRVRSASLSSASSRA